jgi:hypothetical protein
MDPVVSFVRYARNSATQLDFVAGLAEHGESIDGMLGPHWVRDTPECQSRLSQFLFDVESLAASRGRHGVALVIAARRARALFGEGAQAVIDGTPKRWHELRERFDLTLADCESLAAEMQSQASTTNRTTQAEVAVAPAPPPVVIQTAASLYPNPRSVLEVLLGGGATSCESAILKARVEDESGVKGNSLRRALDSLRKTPASCIESASSVAGGIWLTSFGVAVAQCVIDEESESVARIDARTNRKPARKDRASLRNQ